MRWNSPKELVDAARSQETRVDDLEFLAQSEYDFVRVAVASNPNTPLSILSKLIPSHLSSDADQYLAAAIACHSNASAALLERIASILRGHLNGGRDNHEAFRAGVNLCCHPNASIDVIRALLDPRETSSAFRKVVARETTRQEVWNLLQNDRSPRVSKRAIGQIRDTQRDGAT